MEAKILFAFLYYEAQIVMKHKQSLEIFVIEKKLKETSNNNQIYFFSKDNPAEHPYLTILNCEYKHA